MKNGTKQQSVGPDKGQAVRQAREERSARALRDNLRRRKAQARDRGYGGDAPDNAVGDSRDLVNGFHDGPDGT
jgi:hypothetical protein